MKGTLNAWQTFGIGTLFRGAYESTEILFDVYEKYIPRRTRLDGSALLARMREEIEKSEAHCEALVTQTSGQDTGMGGGGR